MTTQCFLRKASEIATPDQVSLGTNAAKLDGTAVGWAAPLPIRTTRGGGFVASANTATVAGTTLGVEVTDGTNPLQWISPPIDADVTISGTITFNLWMGESATAANTGAQCVVERIDSTGAIVSTVANSEKGTELPKYSSVAAQNWTAAPTSTAFNRGDRIRIRVAGNDAGGTMASANTFTLDYAGTSAAADGDSYVQFNETFGFLTANPSTTTIYPASIDAGITGTTDREAWTSRGSGATSSGPNLATGWTAPLASNVQHYTKPLQAFTLDGPVLVHVRVNTTQANKHAAIRVELAVTASDGTGATIWAATSHPTPATTTETAFDLYVAGDTLAVSDNQRIRIKWYADDESTTAMVSGGPLAHFYAGTSAGASGDTYLIFGQTLTEYIAPVSLPFLVTAPYRPA